MIGRGEGASEREAVLAIYWLVGRPGRDAPPLGAPRAPWAEGSGRGHSAVLCGAVRCGAVPWAVGTRWAPARFEHARLALPCLDT